MNLLMTTPVFGTCRLSTGVIGNVGNELARRQVTRIFLINSAGP